MEVDLEHVAGLTKELVKHLERFFPVEGQPAPAMGGPDLAAWLRLLALNSWLRVAILERPQVLVDFKGGRSSLQATSAVKTIYAVREEIVKHYGIPENKDESADFPAPLADLDAKVITRLQAAVAIIDAVLEQG